MSNIYKDTLYNFQKSVVDSANKHKKYLLALDMGLGKTITSLSYMQENNTENLIIVCQTSKVDDWEKEVTKHLGLTTLVLNKGSKKDIENINNFKSGVIIVSYSTAWRRPIATLINKSFNMIIDESQNIKSRTSKIGKWAVSISNSLNRTLLLSGSPMNVPVDLYNQMLVLGMKMTWKKFCENFVIMELMKNADGRRYNKIVGYKNEDLLMRALKTQATFMKTEEAIELPTINKYETHITNEKQSIYNKVKKIKIYKDLEIPTAGVLFMRLRQLSSGFIETYENVSNHKKNALYDLLFSSKDNHLVFYNYVNELKQIKSICKELNIKVFEINGNVKNYQESQNYKGRYIIAGQIQSAHAGHNIQWINHTIYYAPPISFLMYSQSLKRTHRIGQDKKCFYYHLITKNSIEERIYDNLKIGKSYDDKLFAKENDLN